MARFDVAISIEHIAGAQNKTADKASMPPHTTTRRIAANHVGNRPRRDIAGIQSAVQRYMQQGLATSTQRSYQAGQRRYLKFCSAINRPAMPTSEEIMLMFVSHLVQEGLAHTSIKVYLSVVCNLHISAGYHEVFA